MRIRTLLLVIFVSGTALLALAEITGKTWPLFLIWPAFGAALPLSTRGERPGPSAGETPSS